MNVDNAAAWLDAVYSRFVLRDLFGKMVPGLILLSSIAMLLTTAADLAGAIAVITNWQWVAIFGLAWIVGLSVQSCGEWSGLIYHLPSLSEDEKKRWYSDYLEFKSHADIRKLGEHERFVVIMESCGNTSVALYVSLLLLELATASRTYFIGPCWDLQEIGSFVLTIIVVMVLAGFLGRMHREHRKRHYNLLQDGLSQLRKTESKTQQVSPAAVYAKLGKPLE